MKKLNVNRRNIKLRNCFFLIIIALVFSTTHLYAEPNIPEKFMYNLYWSGIRAGSASLAIEDTPEGITITSRAASADFISIFYKVEDMAMSILYPDGYPSVYILNIREGRHRRDKATFFGMKQEDSAQDILYNNRLDNESVQLHVEQQAFDPLSGLYEIRRRNLEVGKSEFLYIFDSKKLWNVEVQVLRKERLNTHVGEVDTVVIKPILQSEGIFMKKGDIFIWLTDDERRMPVLIKSKVKIGSIEARLIDIK